MHLPRIDDDPAPLQPRHWLLLLAVLALYAAMRAPWVGHLLTWDEAMNLCAVRSFAARGNDLYAGWFWHHPPVMNLLLLLARPLAEGFAERGVALFIGIGMLNVVALFLLVRATVGTAPALWAGFCYAVMPAAMFYDLWLKQDPLVSLFGMLSMYAFLRGRAAVSGLLMGLAFLAKEMAVVYVIALGILWLLLPRSRRRWSDAGVAALMTLLTGAWWFLLFSSSLKYYVALMTGLPVAETDAVVWTRPWPYYFLRMPATLGVIGAGLCLAGTVWSVRALLARRRELRDVDRPQRDLVFLWPLAAPLAILALLSIPATKAPWFPTTVHPLLAALGGVGAAWLVAAAGDRVPSARGARALRTGLAALIAAGSIVTAWGRDYDVVLQEQDVGLWWGAEASREAALAMNEKVEDGQKALITPMHYWENRDRDPCPILVYYMKAIPVVVRPYTSSLDELIEAVREYDLDWVLASPDPETAEAGLIRPLMDQYGITPELLRGAILFPAEPLRHPPATTTSAPVVPAP